MPVRIVGDHRWDKTNGWVVDVDDEETLGNLLTHEGFALDDADPLAALVGAPAAVALAVAGVPTVEGLGKLSKTAIERVAKETGRDAEQITTWGEQVRQPAPKEKPEKAERPHRGKAKPPEVVAAEEGAAPEAKEE
jgi:hypothetical protein